MRICEPSCLPGSVSSLLAAAQQLGCTQKLPVSAQPSQPLQRLAPGEWQCRGEQRGAGGPDPERLLRRVSIAVLICGVQSPSMGRRAPPPATEGNQSASYAAAQGAPSAPAAAPEPSALESKAFSEMRALNRCSGHGPAAGACLWRLPGTGSSRSAQRMLPAPPCSSSKLATRLG